MTEQETANAIGAALRDAEASAEAEGATETQAKLKVLHDILTTGYREFFSHLGWDEIAGQGVHTDAGSQKTP